MSERLLFITAAIVVPDEASGEVVGNDVLAVLKDCGYVAPVSASVPDVSTVSAAYGVDVDHVDVFDMNDLLDGC